VEGREERGGVRSEGILAFGVFECKLLLALGMQMVVER
jgi:hypothetical protein